jgi:hypothetical protein
MLRVLQSVTGKNVDAQYKAKVALKRGMFVNKKYDTKEVILPVVASATEIYLVERGLVNDSALSAVGGVVSEYDASVENIAIGEFVNTTSLIAGERYAVDAYSGVDADFDAGKYLIVSTTVDATQGKLIASPTNTKSNFISLGYVMDAGVNKLVGFEFVV